jgi:hypothetical protein
MNIKLVITISVVLIYAVFITVFFTTRKTSFDERPCNGSYRDCVRFCSSDKEKYPDEFLRRKFRPQNWYLQRDYEIARGEPNCGVRDIGYFIRDNSFSSYYVSYCS